MLALIFLFVKCLEILHTWGSKHANWQSVHILFPMNCFCFADRPVERSTLLEQRNFMRTERSWCGSGTKLYHDCWPASAVSYSDSWCCTLADQMPPVLATSTRGKGLRAPARKVSLGRVQPGLRDAAVYPHTHAGMAEIKLYDLTENELEVSLNGELLWTFNFLFIFYFFKVNSELWSQGTPPAQVFEMQCLPMQVFELVRAKT